MTPAGDGRNPCFPVVEATDILTSRIATSRSFRPRRLAGAKSPTGTNHAVLSLAHIDQRNGGWSRRPPSTIREKEPPVRLSRNANLMLGLEETSGLELVGVGR